MHIVFYRKIFWIRQSFYQNDFISLCNTENSQFNFKPNNGLQCHFFFIQTVYKNKLAYLRKIKWDSIG